MESATPEIPPSFAAALAAAQPNNPTVTSPAPVVPLSGAQRAGLYLAYIVLGLIGAAILGLVSSLIWVENKNFPPYNDITQALLTYLASGNDARAALSARRSAADVIFRVTRDHVEPTISDTDLAPVVELVRDLRASGRLSTEEITTSGNLHHSTSSAADWRLVHQPPRPSSSDRCLPEHARLD